MYVCCCSRVKLVMILIMYDVGFMCEKDEKEQRDDYYFAHTNVVTKCSSVSDLLLPNITSLMMFTVQNTDQAHF